MKNAVIGVAESRSQASEILRDLETRGVDAEHVSVAPAAAPLPARKGVENAKLSARGAVGASGGAVIGGGLALLARTELVALLPWTASLVGYLVVLAIAAVLGALLGGAVGLIAGMRVSRLDRQSQQTSCGEAPILIAVQTVDSESEEQAKIAFTAATAGHDHPIQEDRRSAYDAEALRPWGNTTPQTEPDGVGDVGRRSQV